MAFGIDKARSKDWMVFLLGLFTMIKVQVLGTFGVCELYMIYLFFRIRNNPFYKDKNAKRLLICAVIWACSTLLTDLYRNSSLADSAKGVVSIIFLIMLLPVSYWCIYDKPRRILYYAAGLAISAIFGFYFQKSINLGETAKDVWQVYAFEYMAVFLASISFYRNKVSIGYVILLAFGFWSLFHMSRNVFLLFAISLVLIYIVRYYSSHSKSEYRAQTRFRQALPVTAIFLMITFVGVKTVYEDLASDGTLGDRAKEKYLKQKNSSIGLASGRGDFLVSLKMIAESPIIGYGSYAKDKNGIAYQKSRELGLEYIDVKSNPIRKRFIPGHSHILGAWVYNGIFGVPFWIFSIWLILQFLYKALFYDVSLTPMLILLSAMTLWNIMFSPFADRPIIAFYLSTIAIILSNNNRKTIKA